MCAMVNHCLLSRKCSSPKEGESWYGTDDPGDPCLDDGTGDQKRGRSLDELFYENARYCTGCILLLVPNQIGDLSYSFLFLLG